MNDAREHEWEDFEAQARIRWPQRTVCDLEHIKDAEASFAQVLAVRLGIDEAAAEAQIAKWSRDLSAWRSANCSPRASHTIARIAARLSSLPPFGRAAIAHRLRAGPPSTGPASRRCSLCAAGMVGRKKTLNDPRKYDELAWYDRAAAAR